MERTYFNRGTDLKAVVKNKSPKPINVEGFYFKNNMEVVLITKTPQGLEHNSHLINKVDIFTETEKT